MGGKFYTRATGVLRVVKQAHSFCTELKGTAGVIQTFHMGHLQNIFVSVLVTGGTDFRILGKFGYLAGSPVGCLD